MSRADSALTTTGPTGAQKVLSARGFKRVGGTQNTPYKRYKAKVRKKRPMGV